MSHLYADLNASLRLAVRARLIAFTVWLALGLTVIVLVAAQFSGRHPATIALDVGLSVLRLALPLLIVFLTQELFTREFDRRYFLNSLAYPRPRAQFIIGRFLATLTLVLCVLCLLALLLAALVWIVGQGYTQATPVALDYRYVLTLIFLAADLLVITSVATLLAVVAVTPSFVLVGTFGFMLIARSYSSIVALLSQDASLVTAPERYQNSLSLLGYLLPDLGALDIRMISLYSSLELLPANWGMTMIGSMAYAIAVFALTVWLFRRKRFS
jgi:ABC-type transport system involved in multi-copper enzyme maturation permease subunit